MSDSGTLDAAAQPSTADLERKLQEILAGADLHTTSLKKVRSELETVFGVDLTARAAEVKELVLKVFESEQNTGKSETDASHESADEANEEDDFELARRLQEEESSKEKRSLRTRAPEKKSKAKRTTKKTAKDGEKKSQKNNPFNSPCYLSPTLSSLLGVPTLSRPQVVKKLWEYIKENGLQDQSDKRFINCDDKMEAVFGVQRVHMFKMNKILSKHLKLTDDVVAEP